MNILNKESTRHFCSGKSIILFYALFSLVLLPFLLDSLHKSRYGHNLLTVYPDYLLPSVHSYKAIISLNPTALENDRLRAVMFSHRLAQVPGPVFPLPASELFLHVLLIFSLNMMTEKPSRSLVSDLPRYRRK
jgi:cytochrome c oxidase assembly factor CtaG